MDSRCRAVPCAMGVGRVLVGLLFLVVAVFVVVAFRAEPAIAGTCTDSLQAKIDAAPSGATVKANPCVYRQQILITKPITLEGQPGSEIRGSDVWTGWTYGGGYWRSTKTLSNFSQTQFECEPNTDRCNWPGQVFFDDQPFKQVFSNPGTRQFAVDDERRVVLKDDPGDHLVEVSVRRHWVLGTPKADDVTIEGFTMKHAANESRSGALMNREERSAPSGARWKVRNNRLSDAHGAVISLKGSPGLRIINNEISRGGQIGINGAADGEVIQGNRIHHNNTEDYNIAGAGVTEAGGVKFAPKVRNVVFADNEVYRNKGNAVHFDIDTANNTISNNRIHHNARKGIQYELSSGGKIFGNVLWENGWAIPDRMQGGAIVIMNSTTTEVYNNTMAWNADGIAVYALDREGTEWDTVHDVYVHDNTILAKDYKSDPENNLAVGWLQGWANTLFATVNDNRGANNRYWYPDPEGSSARYEWDQVHYNKLANFNLTPGEQNGRYLTQSEKDAVVADKDLPASPLPH